MRPSAYCRSAAAFSASAPLPISTERVARRFASRTFCDVWRVAGKFSGNDQRIGAVELGPLDVRGQIDAGKRDGMFFVHVGKNMNVTRGQFFAFAHQLRGAAMIKFAGIPDARAGENTDADETRFGRERDGEAHHAAVVNYVDAHGDGRIFHDFGGGHGVRGHCFGFHGVANVVRQVPHIFDHEAVHAAVEQRFGVAQRVINDRLHTVAVVAGRAGKRPEMDHPDYRLGRRERDRRAISFAGDRFLFPFGKWSVVGVRVILSSFCAASGL